MKKLLDDLIYWYNEPERMKQKSDEIARRREEELAELRFRIDKLSKKIDAPAPVYEKGYPSYEAVNREEPEPKPDMDDIKAKLMGKR